MVYDRGNNWDQCSWASMCLQTHLQHAVQGERNWAWKPSAFWWMWWCANVWYEKIHTCCEVLQQSSQQTLAYMNHWDHSLREFTPLWALRVDVSFWSSGYHGYKQSSLVIGYRVRICHLDFKFLWYDEWFYYRYLDINKGSVRKVRTQYILV